LAAKTDTERIQLMLDIGFLALLSYPDTCVVYTQRAFEMAQEIKNEREMEFGLLEMGMGLRFLADYPKALDCELKGLQLAEKLNDTTGFVYAYGFIGAIYRDQGYFEQALINANKGKKYFENFGNSFLSIIGFSDLGNTYFQTNQLDSAFFYEEQADRIGKKYGYNHPYIPYTLASIYEKRGDYNRSIEYYRLSGLYGAGNKFLRDILRSYSAIGRIQLKIGNTDSAIYYADLVLKDTAKVPIPIKLEVSKLLSESYERKKNKDSIVKYLKLTSTLQDSLFGQEQARKVQNLTHSETLRQQEMTEEKARIEEVTRENRQNLWLAGSGALLVFLALFGFYRYRLLQLVKLQSVRNEISKDLHDDIGSTLSSISILSEVAKNKMEGGHQDQSISALGKINTYSHEMAEKMSDIVWTVNSRNDSIDNLMQRIKYANVESCALKNISLEMEADESFRRQELPMAFRKNIYMICKEAVHNAIKHANAKRITIQFKLLHGYMQIVILDDGKGFDIQCEKKGNGLGNMQSRAAELYGTLIIESMPDCTSIRLQAPIPKKR
jgi:two-component system, NarL family, sensor histidine kinase UhpB